MLQYLSWGSYHILERNFEFVMLSFKRTCFFCPCPFGRTRSGSSLTMYVLSYENQVYVRSLGLFLCSHWVCIEWHRRPCEIRFYTWGCCFTSWLRSLESRGSSSLSSYKLTLSYFMIQVSFSLSLNSLSLTATAMLLRKELYFCKRLKTLFQYG